MALSNQVIRAYARALSAHVTSHFFRMKDSFQVIAGKVGFLLSLGEGICIDHHITNDFINS